MITITSHYNRHCLRLGSYDRLVTDNKFTCYQSVDISLQFHSVDNNGFQANIVTARSELFERDIINNLAFLHNNCDMLDFRDLNIRHNSGSNFFSPIEFNYLIETTHFSSSKLSFLHLNVRSIRNKFYSVINYLNSSDHKFSTIGLTKTWLNDNDNDDFEIPG